VAAFIPGLVLSERLYRDAVRPILAARYPRLIHSAARLDYGSDVLGFDTPLSMDHGWGPRLTLFLAGQDCDELGAAVAQTLAHELPFEIAGFPTHYTGEGGEIQMQPAGSRPIRHGVAVTTAARFFTGYLGVDPASPIPDAAWLTIPPQRLRTIASGRVFHDGLGQLEPARRALAWYPDDVWFHLMAAQWQRISQDEPFMARCGDAGDDLGSRLAAARLARELMQVCFLIERQHAPYAKWFGTAFARLACAAQLAPVLAAVLDSADWRRREARLSEAYRLVAGMHNRLGVTPLISPEVAPFHSRPYLVPHAERFVEALRQAIRSPAVRAWPPGIGAVWQFSDSTDVLESTRLCRSLAEAAHG
jgi:hypothetical protein